LLDLQQAPAPLTPAERFKFDPDQNPTTYDGPEDRLWGFCTRNTGKGHRQEMPVAPMRSRDCHPQIQHHAY